MYGAAGAVLEDAEVGSVGMDISYGAHWARMNEGEWEASECAVSDGRGEDFLRCDAREWSASQEAATALRPLDELSIHAPTLVVPEVGKPSG